MNKTTDREPAVDPRRYFEAAEPERTDIPHRDPVCLYLETRAIRRDAGRRHLQGCGQLPRHSQSDLAIDSDDGA